MNEQTSTEVCLNPKPRGFRRIVGLLLRVIADRIDGLTSASFEIRCTEQLAEDDYGSAIQQATDALASALQQQALMKAAMRTGEFGHHHSSALH